MNNSRALSRHHYIVAVLAGILFSIALVALITLIATFWGKDSYAIQRFANIFANVNMKDGNILWIFSSESSSLFPLSIQALTYTFFGTALCLLHFRRSVYKHEKHAFDAKVLPDDERTLIQPADIADVRDNLAPYKNSIIVTLVERALQQYQTTLSTSEAASIVTANSDALLNEIDSHYAVIRYLAWAIPSLGFIGTVLGIGQALAGFGNLAGQLPIDFITRHLASAFNTTLIALILSIILMLIINVVQSREEKLISDAQSYCLSNLVNRLFNPEQLTR